ncbi:hypothetical protein PPYR_10510 [Photinus pyralis]|uniref:Uncharacterized protein n=1 Tax=Photinus pyralis TaxID=7054 RepID=A0A5N4AGN3_PHOPY|nr:hypothetical protein PPYR_10510 [Photinus pyralis]
MVRYSSSQSPPGWKAGSTENRNGRSGAYVCVKQPWRCAVHYSKSLVNWNGVIDWRARKMVHSDMLRAQWRRAQLLATHFWNRVLRLLLEPVVVPTRVRFPFGVRRTLYGVNCVGVGGVVGIGEAASERDGFDCTARMRIRIVSSELGVLPIASRHLAFNCCRASWITLDAPVLMVFVVCVFVYSFYITVICTVVFITK